MSDKTNHALSLFVLSPVVGRGGRTTISSAVSDISAALCSMAMFLMPLHEVGSSGAEARRATCRCCKAGWTNSTPGARGTPSVDGARSSVTSAGYV